MAEGWAKALKPGVIMATSAGIERHGMNPLTVRAMAEEGVDITSQWSKTLEDLNTSAFDYVITLCGHAHETCPHFAGQAMVFHHGFDDPAILGQGLPEEEAMENYRRVCAEIRAYVEALPGNLPARTHQAQNGFTI